MPQHARPLPPPPRTPGLTIHPTIHVPTGDAPAATPVAPAAPAPVPAPEPRADAPPATPAPPAGSGRPWYRSEPWLAVLMAAFVPLLGASIAPASTKLPLIGIGGGMIVVGLVMLLRHDRAARDAS